MDINEICQLLPHRYPFLLVDRVVEFEADKRIVAIKNVTINEPQFNGHFPGNPVFPGVMIVKHWRKLPEFSLLRVVIEPWLMVTSTILPVPIRRSSNDQLYLAIKCALRLRLQT